MIGPLLCFALQLPTAPVIPPGLNEACVHAAYAVEGDLAGGKFDQALTDAAYLPTSTIRFKWDDSGVPSARKEDFRLACQNAMTEWKQAVPKLAFEENGDADVVFTFTGSLPKTNDDTFPPGNILTFGSGPKPRLTDQIALERMDPPEPIDTNVVHNEVAFAIGQYLGLEEMPHFSGFATRTNQNTKSLVAWNRFEQALAQASLDLADALRTLCSKHQAVIEGKPDMGLSTAKIEGVKGYQDEPLQISFNVMNSGNSDLRLFVLPDCGCLSPQSPSDIKPKGTGTILANVNTDNYVGHLEHSLLIYSNSPDWPIERIPVTMDVEPAYKFIQPDGNVHAIGPNGASFDVYLEVSAHSDIPVLTASLVGVKGIVDFHPWSGIVPGDPDSSGEIKGYKFHIQVKPLQDYGRIPAGLMLGTANSAFREISCTVDLQKGIVAMPGQVYFGSVSKEAKTVRFLVSSPAGEFKITRIDTGSPFLSGTCEPTKNKGEYEIALTYNGKAEYGLLKSDVAVHVDDPKQPVIHVRAEADVQ